MNIEHVKDAPKTIRLGEIPVGTVFEGLLGGQQGVFIAAYGVIVDLERPLRTWPTATAAEVSNYRVLNAKLVITDGI